MEAGFRNDAPLKRSEFEIRRGPDDVVRALFIPSSRFPPALAIRIILLTAQRNGDRSSPLFHKELFIPGGRTSNRLGIEPADHGCQAPAP